MESLQPVSIRLVISLLRIWFILKLAVSWPIYQRKAIFPIVNFLGKICHLELFRLQF